MNKFFIETNKVKIKNSYDVIVAGGGIAGCASAIAAARCGCKVLIVEKTVALGGLATNGLVVYYFPSLCTINGKKVTGGLAEELLHTSIKYGYNTLSPKWKYGMKESEPKIPYTTMFSASSFIGALDELISDNKIDVLFDSVCCNIKIENGICQGVFIENKEGRVYYKCKQLIDTTGDVDLFHRAGAPCKEDLNWLSFWGIFINLDRMKTCIERNDIKHAIDIKEFGASYDGKNNPEGVRRYTIETGEEVSEFIKRGRKYFLDYIKTMDTKKEMAVSIPSQAQYRTTRMICGEYILSDIDKNKYHDDSVGVLASGGKKEFLIEVPYRSMIVKGFKNMITAGRTIAAKGSARGITRVIGACAMTGHAAGIAASIAIKKNCEINKVPIDELQYILKEQNAIIHYQDIEK